MGAFYDEIEIEDMVWDSEKGVYHYPCPCGDRFEISRSQLANYEDVATCPSCSLIVRVIYDPLDFEDEEPEEDEGESGESDDEEDEESGSKEDQFENAMKKLVISDTPATVVDPVET